jgi:hypothetical protein
MSVEWLPSVGFTLTLPDAATLVQVSDALYGAYAQEVPDNCRAIIVYNMDAQNRIFMRFGDTTTITVGNTTVLSSTVIPAGGSVTVGLDYLGERQALNPTSRADLFFIPEGGTNVQVNITYLMGRGLQVM